MSQYLGRNKNKSRSRYIARTLEENKKKEGMREVFDIMKDIKESQEKPVCYVCGRPAYKSDSHNYICESLAYKGHCKPLETESVENRIKENGIIKSVDKYIKESGDDISKQESINSK